MFSYNSGEVFFISNCNLQSINILIIISYYILIYIRVHIGIDIGINVL